MTETCFPEKIAVSAGSNQKILQKSLGDRIQKLWSLWKAEKSLFKIKMMIKRNGLCSCLEKIQ